KSTGQLDRRSIWPVDVQNSAIETVPADHLAGLFRGCCRAEHPAAHVHELSGQVGGNDVLVLEDEDLLAGKLWFDHRPARSDATRCILQHSPTGVSNPQQDRNLGESAPLSGSHPYPKPGW